MTEAAIQAGSIFSAALAANVPKGNKSEDAANGQERSNRYQNDCPRLPQHVQAATSPARGKFSLANLPKIALAASS